MRSVPSGFALTAAPLAAPVQAAQESAPSVPQRTAGAILSAGAIRQFQVVEP